MDYFPLSAINTMPFSFRQHGTRCRPFVCEWHRNKCFAESHKTNAFSTLFSFFFFSSARRLCSSACISLVRRDILVFVILKNVFVFMCRCCFNLFRTRYVFLLVYRRHSTRSSRRSSCTATNPLTDIRLLLVAYDICVYSVGWFSALGLCFLSG